MKFPYIPKNLWMAPELQLSTLSFPNPTNINEFHLGTNLFTIRQRLDRGYGLAERYLAQDDSGELVCLSRFVGKTHDQQNIRRGVNQAALIEIARKAFLSEFEILSRLGNKKRETGTYFFPRVLSGVYDISGVQPMFVIEYMKGRCISKVPLDVAQAAKSKFIEAFLLAHSIGVHFADLRPEDLLVTDYGGVHIIDFNSTEYYDIGVDNPNERDFKKLELIYKELEEGI